MTSDKDRPGSARTKDRSTSFARGERPSGGFARGERPSGGFPRRENPPPGSAAEDPDAETADAGDEPVQNALVEESDRLMSAVDEIKRLESEKRRLPMSTPEFHEAASRIERIARQVFGIARAQREVGEALQSQHDESIDDEARERDAKDRASAVSGRERRR
jgi:hypothetical protein